MRQIPIALLGALFALAAAAHTQISSTMPADGAALNAAP